MALSEYAGRLFRVMPERIELFGLMGAHHGASWVVGVPFGETYVPCEVMPAPASGTVLAVIEQDRARGREHLIDSIQVTNRVAVCLFLEGVLTFDHFARAVEQDGVIVVPDVPLSGNLWTLRIGSERTLASGVMTLDSFGQVV